MLLARALASPDTETRIVRAVITALGTVSGTVTIDLGADRTVDAETLAGQTLAIGDVVFATRMDATGWLVLGKRAEAITSPPFATSWTLPWTVKAAPSGAASGTLTVDAASAGGWRPDTTPAWWTDQPSQGYYAYPSQVYQGAWFYGSSAFSSIAGRSCTSLTLRVSRPSVGGISGAVTLYVRLHRNATKPASAPSWHSIAAKAYAGPAWGGTTTITLPTSWGQALIDGTARGVGLYYSGSSQYAKLNNLATDSQCGRLTLGWG